MHDRLLHDDGTAAHAIPLKEILQAEGTPLPWKFRILLALHLDSSLL